MSGMEALAEWHPLSAVAVVRPTHFRLTDPVNDTQRRWYGRLGRPSAERLNREHAGVVAALATVGVRIVDVLADPACPLQFNVRDAAVVVGSTMILARLKPVVRQRESTLVSNTFPGAELLASGYLEGGDVMLTPTEMFVGISERTDREGIRALQTVVGTDTQVTPVPLAGALHLDVALSLLDYGVGLIYRPAITGSLPDSLDKLDLVDVTTDEFDQLAVHVLPLGPSVVLVDERHERLGTALECRGFRCIRVDLDEITKVGGGIRCMTLPLHRKPPNQPRYGGSRT